MSHFAHIGTWISENIGVVDQVIVIEQETLNAGHWGNPDEWIQTSYNTSNGVHRGLDGQPDGGVALRGNYAGIGMLYDKTNDKFYAVQPYPSWTLNQTTWYWEPPTPYPTDGKQYIWDEATVSWKEVA